MQYFFDSCIAYRYAHTLNALGIDAVALRDEYPEDIKDVPLFSALAGRDAVFVSQDKHQLTRQSEARELKKAVLTAIYFEPFWNKLQFWDQATWLVKHWRTIENFSEAVKRGTVASIKERGKIHFIQF
ncbi:MAG: hypothetical protein H8E66_11390 [Planctomycetes bacterium]|nr:hypothetical protein [Planctomycetota bacterium]